MHRMAARTVHLAALTPLILTLVLVTGPLHAKPAETQRVYARNAALPPGVAPPPPATPIPGVLYAGRYGNDGLIVYPLTASGNCGKLDAGGGVVALLVDPRAPHSIYAGSAKGLAISVDACKSWRPVAGIPAGGVSALAADAVSGAIYAALVPDALLASVDGVHWLAHRLPRPTRISSLALEPGSPATLLVGTGLGLFATRDGGATWSSPAPQLAGAKGINALAVDPTRPDVLFAATGTDLFRSADSGATWRSAQQLPSYHYPLNDALPSHALRGFTAVAVNVSGVVLAGDDVDELRRSPDHGQTWGPSGFRSVGGKDGFPAIAAIGFDPSLPSHAYALDTNAVQGESRDGGNSWDQAGDGNGGFVAALAGTSRPPLPTDPVPPPVATQGTRYVVATRHTIGAPFLTFYQASGGVRIFGLPLTEPYIEGGQRVQVFERARLVAAAGSVTVSPLGAWLTAGRSFPQTEQSLRGVFLAFWQAHRGTRIFGPPISPELHEPNGDGSGRTYLVQYFRNARLEYHPELRGTPYATSVGLLGLAYLQARGML